MLAIAMALLWLSRVPLVPAQAYQACHSISNARHYEEVKPEATGCGVGFWRAAGSTEKGDRVVKGRVSIPLLGPKPETARPRPSDFDPVKRSSSDNLPWTSATV